MPNYKRLYIPNHSYFITVVTQNREPILIENIDLLRESFRRSRVKYNYQIDSIVILPDHFHTIITPQISTEYSKIISFIKRSFIYGLDENLKQRLKTHLTSSQYHRQHSGVWQRRFYEHTIRDENELYHYMLYIQNNPIKHGLITTDEEWKYSSFYKSNEDNYNI